MALILSFVCFSSFRRIHQLHQTAGEQDEDAGGREQAAAGTGNYCSDHFTQLKTTSVGITKSGCSPLWHTLENVHTLLYCIYSRWDFFVWPCDAVLSNQCIDARGSDHLTDLLYVHTYSVTVFLMFDVIINLMKAVD